MSCWDMPGSQRPTGGPVFGTAPTQKQPTGKQPAIDPANLILNQGAITPDPNRYLNKTAPSNSGNPQTIPANPYPNGVASPTPSIPWGSPPIGGGVASTGPTGSPANPTGTIDYSRYAGNKSPMDAYAMGALPQGFDWDKWTQATGVPTKSPDGRDLDNTGTPITHTFNAAYGQPTNGTPGPPPGSPPVGAPAPPPSTPPPATPPPATPPPAVPGQPVTGSPNGQPEVLVPPPAPVVPVNEGQPVNSGVENLVPNPTLPIITQPSVPKTYIPQPTFAPGAAPQQSGNPVVNALMKRYKRNLWDF